MANAESDSRTTKRSAARVRAAAGAFELRLRRAKRPLTDAWRQAPIESRRSTLLGISFRAPHVAALGLDPRDALGALLTYPFHLIRLGAYWNRIEPQPGVFDTDELDWQLDAAERAGVDVILCLGPLKTFGYPEFFVPAHHLRAAFPERTRITPSAYPALLTAATDLITRLVERYKHRTGIVAWQLEHEAVDPLGFEHSWRLDSAFVAREVEAVRQTDPTRPIMMNGFLPTSAPVQLIQWWRTRDQGDSLDVAQRLADVVGIDYYPRHALLAMGSATLYLDGAASPWQQRRVRQLFAWTRAHDQKVMVAEGQAEPWETVTTPPNPAGQGMSSCLPEHVITNYNACMRWRRPAAPLYAYLFWGAEYWMLRKQCGDSSYLHAFARILENA